jgi:hypothetical protein
MERKLHLQITNYYIRRSDNQDQSIEILKYFREQTILYYYQAYIIIYHT